MSLELLELGLNLAGGIFGNRSKDRQQRRQLEQAQHQFNQQMDHSVQRRVLDAKRAGVHPLFALGASVGASPTISAGGESGGNPMQSALSAMAQTLNSLETNKASARRDNAEAALLDSERARINQALTNGGQGSDSEALQVVEKGVKTYPYPGDKGYNGPATYYSPEIPFSKKPGIRAGTVPGTVDVQLPDGRQVNLLSQDLGLDEISQVDYVYQRAQHKVADFLMSARPYVSDAAIINGIKRIFRETSKTINSTQRIRN